MTASSSTANPVGPLGDFLRLAREGTMPWGWIYFPTGTSEPDLQTTCILVTDSSVEVDASHRPVFAVERGFDVEGLDADAIEAIVDGARKFRDPPDDKLLLEAFNYYRTYDAFLPRPGAEPPPSVEETMRKLDREFYDCLGDELPERPCKRPGCSRGAVPLSVMCRVHHFEMIKERPCPFND